MTRRARSLYPAFTLLELLAAMAITTVLVLVIVQMTNSVLRLWPYGKDRVQKNMDARMALELLAQDIRAEVVRARSSQTQFQWLETRPETNIGPSGGYTATNASWLMFFAVPQDRAGSSQGDVCAVSYRLGFADPIEQGGERKSFGLYRRVVDPPTTFRDALGKADLYNDFWKNQPTLLPEDYLVANVVNFSIMLLAVDSAGKRFEIPASAGVKLNNRLEITNPPIGMPAGTRLVAMDISLSIVSDHAARRLEKNLGDPLQTVKENATTFTKRISLPE